MVTTRHRYLPPGIKQKLLFQGHLIGCTDTSFAIAVRGVTCGGMVVTEAQVRAASPEHKPDPASPGLNLKELVVVAKKWHVSFTNMTHHNFDELHTLLDANHKSVLQLWYADIGGTNIGHAVYGEAISAGKIRIIDPMKGTREWLHVTDVHHAMRTFADKAGVHDGLMFGVTAAAKWISANQKPTGQ